MNNFAERLIAVLTLTFLFTSSVNAQTTSARGEFSLQGRLTTGLSNQAVADGQYNVTIKVYEEGTGNVVLTETDVVMVRDGIFSTMVGDNATLSLETDTEYEIGVSIDGGAELSPRIEIGDAPSAITADVAADAEAVAGLTVSTTGGANTIVATNAQGRLSTSLLTNSISITGTGAVVDTIGGRLNLDFAAGTGLTLPFIDTVTVGMGETVFGLTAMGQGSTATLLNAGSGGALRLMANSTGSAALDIGNTSGAAINAVGSFNSGAVLNLQNTSTNANATLITALDAGGDAVFEVMADGQTVINSTVGPALEVNTTAAGEAALKVTGGLLLDGPVGTGTITAGQTSVNINNALVDENSIILLTVNSATSLTNGIRLASQGNGTFTVSLLDSTLGSLTGGLDFNYLIINTVNP